MHPAPRAVSVTRGSREWLLACNREARACGVRFGMLAPSAYALTAKLIVHSRDEVAERVALERIAGWAGQFTPGVSLVFPDSVVLEIGGSIKLFGGLTTTLERLRAGLQELGYDTRLAAAPTPLGATWLVRNGVEEPVTDKRRLHTCLAPLPVQSLNLDAETLEKLEGLGLRCIGDCLRLPRDGLARRLGSVFLLNLDRALGKQPDPRFPYVPPPRFASGLLLPAPAESRETLLFATRRLLLELTGFLTARLGGVQAVTLEMDHHEGSPTRVTLNLVSLTRDPDYLQQLLSMRLERLKLRAPVQEIRLAAGEVHPLPESSQDLLTRSRTDSTELDQLSEQAGNRYLLIERLRARLGNDAVRGLRLVPEHRPERAYHISAPGDVGPCLTFGARPLWLLVEPFPLRTIRGSPWLQGKLRLKAGPERIESGWWDGQDVAREYFVAQNSKGSRFWIFCERRQERRWFLHGIFA
ncbi:MAG: DNA polymerase Y family protein [Acidiferrobacterales bacterium]